MLAIFFWVGRPSPTIAIGLLTYKCNGAARDTVAGLTWQEGLLDPMS